MDEIISAIEEGIGCLLSLVGLLLTMLLAAVSSITIAVLAVRIVEWMLF